MQSISLVPSTAYNTSIYIADRKNCSGGSIVLEDRITDYFMPISETTAVSVDMSLLHPVPSSSIKFTLIICSTGSNVINLSGFSVEQIQVLDGLSVFTVQRGLDESLWNIQMTSSDVRPERWLRCYDRPTAPEPYVGIYNYFNLCYSAFDRTWGNLSTYAPGQTAADGAYGTFYRYGDSGYIYAKFPNPVWLKSVTIAVTTNTGWNLGRFPDGVQIYGTNDGYGWTQLVNTSLTAQYGSVDTYMCTTTNYYTMFKFVFHFPNTADYFVIPSISLSGFPSELINPGAYVMATPPCPSLPNGGFDVETNSSEMTSTQGSVNDLTLYNGSYRYKMVRSNANTPWEYIYTFPDPIRTIGISVTQYQTSCIGLFGLSYSDDKTNWTEYCKVDGTLEAWAAGARSEQNYAYYYDSGSKHQYYKITIYSRANGDNETFFNGLGFLQFKEGLYLTFESFVPKLSSNTQSGYMLIASSASQGDAYHLFDNNVKTYGGGDITDGQWSLLITLPQATIVRGLELVAPYDGYNRMPYAFSLQGSDDNDTWVNIKTFTLGSSYWTYNLQVGQWDTDNDTAYKYYRIIATASSQGSTIRIGSMGLSSYASFKGVNWYEFTNTIPAMQSNSQDGYVSSCDSTYGGNYPAWKAFNRSDGGWVSGSGSTTAVHWLKIFNNEGIEANAFNFAVHGSNRPVDFVIQGSDDDSTWTDEVTVTGNLLDTLRYTLQTTKTYKYWRFYCTQNANGRVEIFEWNIGIRTDHTSN